MAVRIPKKLLGDLEQILQENDEASFEALHAKINQDVETLLTRSELPQIFSELSQSEKAHNIFQWLIHQCKANSFDEVVQILDQKISDQENWKSIREKFLEILEAQRLVTSVIAISLSFEYPNLLTEARVLTDIRPVFKGEAADSIQGATVSQSLKITYFRDGHRDSITFAMDMVDLDDLIRECERAKKKAETSKNLMESVDVPTIITGEELDND